ncbi:MAG: DMT family transporter [Haloarculaceae archaeon]
MSRYRDVVGFGILVCVWGFGFAAAEIGFSTFPPLLLMAFRYDIGAVLLFGYVVVAVDDWWPSTRGDYLAVLSGGVLMMVVGNGVWFVGQRLTTSVFSGMMASLIPVTTAAFSWVVLPDDRLTPLSLIGLGVSFVGASIITLSGNGLTFGASLLGKGLLFASVCGMALASVFIRRADASIPSTAQTAWSVLLGAVLLHLLSPLVGETWGGTVTVASGLALAFLGVFSTVVVWLLYFGLLERYSAIELSMATYLVPLVAAAVGWALFGEPVTRAMVVGFPVVVSGFVLMKRRTLRTELRRLLASA